MRIPEPEKPIHRFPRTKDPVILFVARLRAKYPPPEYNWKYGGSINPADLVFQCWVATKKKKLRKWCENHSLETWGNKRRLIKRLYLHWRAAKLQLGDPYIGYGEGFKSTRTPNCACGFRKRADIIKEQKEKEKAKAMVRRQRKVLDRVWRYALAKQLKEIIRFPRIRFPRFRDPEDSKKYYNRAFRKVVNEL